jgi:hypothetical protein
MLHVKWHFKSAQSTYDHHFYRLLADVLRNKRTETDKLPPHHMKMTSKNTKDNCTLSWSRHTSKYAQLLLPQSHQTPPQKTQMGQSSYVMTQFLLFAEYKTTPIHNIKFSRKHLYRMCVCNVVQHYRMNDELGKKLSSCILVNREYYCIILSLFTNILKTWWKHACYKEKCRSLSSH